MFRIHFGCIHLFRSGNAFLRNCIGTCARRVGAYTDLINIEVTQLIC